MDPEYEEFDCPYEEEICDPYDGSFVEYEENIIEDAYEEIDEEERVEELLEEMKELYHERVLAVIGAQFGDEGKGKKIDLLTYQYDIIVRGNGGANAGHTVVVNGKEIICHLVSSGVLHPKKDLVLGDNCVVNIEGLIDEMESLEERGLSFYKDPEEEQAPRFHISDRATITFTGLEKAIDGIIEDRKTGNKVGTTKRGIGPTYAALANRHALRMGDLKYLSKEQFEDKFWDHYNMCLDSYPEIARKYPGKKVYNPEAEIEKVWKLREKILPFIEDTVSYLDRQYEEGKRILFEGANGTMLDLNHGTYPGVTSSNTKSGGVINGAGMAANKLTSVVSVVKAYTTRVGEGPFTTEGGVPIESENEMLHGTYKDGDIGNYLRKGGHEFGATTGRPRRCGWIDIQQLKYSFTLNGTTEINLSKLDVLTGLKEIKIVTGYIVDGKEIDTFPVNIDQLLKEGRLKLKVEKMPGWNEKIRHCTDFDKLPENAKKYVNRLEELLGRPVTTIGVGPGRGNMIVKGLSEQDILRKRLRDIMTHDSNNTPEITKIAGQLTTAT